jgi:hypothetical protein
VADTPPASACWFAGVRASAGWPISMLLSPCAKAKMIALDTNIRARFYVDDPADQEAAAQRCPSSDRRVSAGVRSADGDP